MDQTKQIRSVSAMYLARYPCWLGWVNWSIKF